MSVSIERPAIASKPTREIACPWCKQPNVDWPHVQSCPQLPPDGLERIKRAKKDVADAFGVLVRHDGRKRETKEEFIAYITLFGREALKHRLPRPLHYDSDQRLIEARYVRMVRDARTPIFLRGVAYEALERRFPELLDTILRVNMIPGLSEVQVFAKEYAAKER